MRAPGTGRCRAPQLQLVIFKISIVRKILSVNEIYAPGYRFQKMCIRMYLSDDLGILRFHLINNQFNYYYNINIFTFIIILNINTFCNAYVLHSTGIISFTMMFMHLTWTHSHGAVSSPQVLAPLLVQPVK